MRMARRLDHFENLAQLVPQMREKGYDYEADQIEAKYGAYAGVPWNKREDIRQQLAALMQN